MLPESIQQDERAFTAREYVALWEEYGLAHLPKHDQVLASFGRGPVARRTTSTLEEVRALLGDCQRCGLCRSRKQIVFGIGNPHAKLMFVGEAPGEDEDAVGDPFVGKSGQLLDKIIEAMGYRREQVYLTNLVKCHSPKNQPPAPEEIAECLPFLKAQLESVAPRVLVALGGTAAAALLGKDISLKDLRGKFHSLPGFANLRMVATFHPALLLQNSDRKREVWADMKQVKALLESHP